MDQISFFSKITDGNENLQNIIVLESKKFPHEFIIKLKSEALDELTQSLQTSNFNYKILPPLVHYFATNVPTNLPNHKLEELLTKVYPQATFTRLTEHPRCAFISIPSKIVDADASLTLAKTFTKGIPIKLPSCEHIYLRPKRKKSSKINQPIEKKSKLVNQFSYAQAARNDSLSHPLSHQTNIQNSHHSERLQALESQFHNMEKNLSQIQASKTNLQEEINSIKSEVKQISININNKLNNIETKNEDTNQEIKSLARNMNAMTNTFTLFMKSQTKQTELQVNDENTFSPKHLNKRNPSRSRSYLDSPNNLPDNKIESKKNQVPVSLEDYQMIKKLKADQERGRMRIEDALANYLKEDHIE